MLTVDDDIVYEQSHIKRLIKGYMENSGRVIGCRGKEIALEGKVNAFKPDISNRGTGTSKFLPNRISYSIRSTVPFTGLC